MNFLGFSRSLQLLMLSIVIANLSRAFNASLSIWLDWNVGICFTSVIYRLIMILTQIFYIFQSVINILKSGYFSDLL